MIRDDREVMIYAGLASLFLGLAITLHLVYLSVGLYCLLMAINAIVRGHHD